MEQKQKANFALGVGSMFIGVLSGQTSSQEIDRQGLNMQIEIKRLNREGEQADREYRQAQSRLEEMEQDIREAEDQLQSEVRGFARLEEGIKKSVLDDVFLIEEGKSFIGQEVHFFISNDPEPTRYLPALHRFAEGKASLKILVDTYTQAAPGSAARNDAYQKILAEIQKVEIYSTLKERRLKAPVTDANPFFLSPRDEALLGSLN